MLSFVSSNTHMIMRTLWNVRLLDYRAGDTTRTVIGQGFSQASLGRSCFPIETCISLGKSNKRIRTSCISSEKRPHCLKPNPWELRPINFNVAPVKRRRPCPTNDRFTNSTASDTHSYAARVRRTLWTLLGVTSAAHRVSVVMTQCQTFPFALSNITSMSFLSVYTVCFLFCFFFFFFHRDKMN